MTKNLEKRVMVCAIMRVVGLPSQTSHQRSQAGLLTDQRQQGTEIGGSQPSTQYVPTSYTGQGQGQLPQTGGQQYPSYTSIAQPQAGLPQQQPGGKCLFDELYIHLNVLNARKACLHFLCETKEEVDFLGNGKYE